MITVYSEKGKGAKFSIYLPASEKQIEKQTPAEPRLRSENGSILMVDDEAQFRATTQKILNRKGFETIIAAITGASDNVVTRRNALRASRAQEQHGDVADAKGENS